MSSSSMILVVASIWAVVVIGFLVWYLWAMARLFPRIGLPSWEGWIPLWNQWRLLDRAGLPGWIVLLAFIPGLGIVPLVFLIIAMHRINTEVGVGAGYTVLGVFIPALWATLLANVIGTARVVYPGTAPVVGAGAAVAAPAPGFAAPAAAPGFAPPPAASAAPAQWNPAAGVPAPAPAVPQPPSPLGAATDAEFARLAAEPFAAPPAAPLGQQAQPEPFSWTAASRAEAPPAPPAPPIAPPMHPAAPALADVPAAPLPPAPPVATPLPPAPPAPPAAPAPPAPPAFSAPPVAPPAPPAPVPGDTASSASPWAPVTGSVPSPVGAGGKATGITGAFQPLRDADVAALAGGVVGAATGAAAASGPSDDPLDDRTVVVPRPRAAKWELQLPDGEAYVLEPDVVVGRRPEAVAGSSILAITDSTRTLSKSHVRLRFDGQGWTVEDLGSTNGLVLLHDDGRQEELDPHRETAATERMMFGTLEVTLRLGGDAA